jgi:2-oxoisovalerate dehydrogenase E1 component alpha subunit
VTKWAAERARANLGATMIELFSYRAGAHSTSDDPSRYRPADEAKCWPLGDPVERLKDHLIGMGEWSERQHTEAQEAAVEAVRAAGREAEAVGVLSEDAQQSRASMFEDVYKDVPWHLAEQRDEESR